MQIKILCLNLFEGGLFWENIQMFIQRENPDILCLQEVFNASPSSPQNFQSIKRIQELLPTYAVYFSPELHEVWSYGEGDQGNAIFSRFPIRHTQTTFLHGSYQRFVRPEDEKDFSHYPKNIQCAVVDIHGCSLHVFNLHGIWGSHGRDTPQRLKMSEIIESEIQGKKYAVLTGDFNVQPDTETIFRLESHMTNVFKNELESTFNMKHKTNPGYASAIVDMFFVSPNISVVEKLCPDDDVSDHKPLLVTVEVSE